LLQIDVKSKKLNSQHKSVKLISAVLILADYSPALRVKSVINSMDYMDFTSINYMCKKKKKHSSLPTLPAIG